MPVDNPTVRGAPDTPAELGAVLDAHRAGYRNGYEDGLSDAARGRQYAEDYCAEDADELSIVRTLLTAVCAVVLLWSIWVALSEPHPKGSTNG